MGELQWALLIVCVVLVVALYVLSRRAKSDRDGDGDDAESLAAQQRSAGQMDLLSPPRGGAYDEFGVGPKRKRGESTPDLGSMQPREVPAPSIATLLNPLPGQSPVAPRVAPESVSAAGGAAQVASKPAAAPMASKLVALIVAPTEETDILGPQLHQALAAQGLRFGEGEVYHRMIGGRIVYSVASLLKPGKLVPAEAEGFSTKGLTVLMNLPGPVSPAVALDDMLETTRGLARALKAEIFNAQRERVTDEVGASLRAEVLEWARTQKVA